MISLLMRPLHFIIIISSAWVFFMCLCLIYMDVSYFKLANSLGQALPFYIALLKCQSL